jgi:hypothetical protein
VSTAAAGQRSKGGRWSRHTGSRSRSSSSRPVGTGHSLLWSALELGRQLDRQMQLPHKTVVSLVGCLGGVVLLAAVT